MGILKALPYALLKSKTSVPPLIIVCFADLFPYFMDLSLGPPVRWNKAFQFNDSHLNDPGFEFISNFLGHAFEKDIYF